MQAIVTRYDNGLVYVQVDDKVNQDEPLNGWHHNLQIGDTIEVYRWDNNKATYPSRVKPHLNP